MQDQPEEKWHRVRTMDEALAACDSCSEILFVRGSRERFDAISFTLVVKDSDEVGPRCHEPAKPSDVASLCDHYLQWLHPRIESERTSRRDNVARIELWTNGRKLHLFEKSPSTATRRLESKPAGELNRKQRIRTCSQRRPSRNGRHRNRT